MKATEAIDVRALQRELHETQKTVKYLRKRLDRSTASSRAPDASAADLERARREIDELKEVKERQRKRLSATKNELKQLKEQYWKNSTELQQLRAFLPSSEHDDCAIYFGGVKAYVASLVGEEVDAAWLTHPVRTELWMPLTIMLEMARLVDAGGEDLSDDAISLVRDALVELLGLPLWHDALHVVASEFTCIQGEAE